MTTEEQISKIAQHVAWVVADTDQGCVAIDQANGDPHEKRRRTDMAMVATLEVVVSVLPEPVQTEVKRLIALHNKAWRGPGPETQCEADGGFGEFRRQGRMQAFHAGEEESAVQYTNSRQLDIHI